MFRKEDKAAETKPSAGSKVVVPPAHGRRSTAPGRDAPHSVISAGLKVVGNLESEDELQVYGTVDGDIAGRTLTVAEGATVNGVIRAESIVISGTVSGEVAAMSIIVAKSGQVLGDVHYQWLSVEKGALVDGRCLRLQGEQGRDG